jgi:hypothetical protein
LSTIVERVEASVNVLFKGPASVVVVAVVTVDFLSKVVNVLVSAHSREKSFASLMTGGSQLRLVVIAQEKEKTATR